ncbi:MAG: formate dehydrogenase accessory sulfurtransferase FdhD, partial [Kiloniellales bacterium]|nr:formate dehydrogenase accessory sulfurtransferase FdhD [Kiloniellales bacterium]
MDGDSRQPQRAAPLRRARRSAADEAALDDYVLRPDPADPHLTRQVAGVDQDGTPVETAVVMERPLTLFLNGQEIVTMMTIGDHPDLLAVGYLL